MRLPVASPLIRASFAAAKRSSTIMRTANPAAQMLLHPSRTIMLPLVQQQQVRLNWQIVLQPVRDETGQLKYPDWDVVVRTVGFPEPTKHQKSLLDRHLKQEEHIKPTELKRRINSRKIYQRSIKRVEDLKTYIKFIQDNRTD